MRTGSYTMVARLLKKTAVRSQHSNTKGNYMDFADPRMVRSRNSFKKLQKDRGIDLRMLLNFDQTWKPLHRQRERPCALTAARPSLPGPSLGPPCALPLPWPLQRGQFVQLFVPCSPFPHCTSLTAMTKP